ncbi:MAG: MerR family transcriptional regulator [Chloroflexia bacterium]|nr:MerR family transcriptional regulator [Chloroflexia bacterium]
MRTIDLARTVELSTQQVRNYEAMGLLPVAEREASGYRLYSQRHLDALRTVRAMMAAGYDRHQVQAVMRAAHDGDLDAALAVVDGRHAELDRQRRQVELTLDAIRTLEAGDTRHVDTRRFRALRIGEAAKAASVQPSALRFWEGEGLLQPDRDEGSGYRLYDQRQLHRLQVVVLLRGANYSFDAIRSVLDELSEGKPGTSLRAVERRRGEIAASSLACARASGALLDYVLETP